MKPAHNRLSTEQFIQKAQAIHGLGKYDYSQAHYVNSKTSITIICPTHGAFEQQPTNHMQSQGCPKCGRQKMEASKRITCADFISRAREVHGERYDYSQAVYTNCKLKVNITCPAHGQFSQEASSHLMGVGCPGCGRATVEAATRKSTAWFIEAAKEIHGERYDYSLVHYESTHRKVKIGCTQHGVFEQSPAGHIHQKQGCLMCYKQAKAEAARLSWVQQANGRSGRLYFIRLFDCQEEFYKVGVTYHSVDWRYRSNAGRADYKYEILAQHTSANSAAIYDWEQSILETFDHIRYKPKRPFDGASECFFRASEILAIFPL